MLLELSLRITVFLFPRFNSVVTRIYNYLMCCVLMCPILFNYLIVKLILTILEIFEMHLLDIKFITIVTQFWKTGRNSFCWVGKLSD